MHDWPDRSEHVVARWIARQLLRFAEFVYLFAYGWRRTSSTKPYPVYTAPGEHPKAEEMIDGYAHDHAINSTKYYLRGGKQRGRPRATYPHPRSRT